MAIKDKSIKYAKEVDDVLVLVEAAIYNRKNKEQLSKLLPQLMDAISGIEDIDDEVAEDRGAVLSTIGYRLGTIANAVLKPQKPAVVPAVVPMIKKARKVLKK